jgi:hypothetical protein
MALEIQGMREPTGNKREEIDFAGKRIRHYSSLTFDEVLARLWARVGETTIDNVVGQPGTREEFAKKIQQYVGASGFMLMAQVDHSRPIGKYGIQRRLLRWIFGNPLIAITMLRHDYTAGLFVPIELLLAESDDGASCGARAGRQGRSSGRRGRDD